MSDIALIPLLAFQEDGKYLAFVDGNPGLFYLLIVNVNNENDSEKITTSENPINFEICKSLKDLFTSLSIPNHFCSATDMGSTKHFINSNISININEVILFIFAEIDGFSVFEYCYTKLGYEYKKSRTVKWDSKKPLKALQHEILVSCNPKKIIFQKSKLELSMKALKSALKPIEFIVVENTPILPKHVTEISKWFFNSFNNSKFHVIPTISRTYRIIVIIGTIQWLIISADVYDRLPFNTSVEVTKLFQKVSMLQYNSKTKKCDTLYDLKNPTKCHKIKIIFNIDEQHFPSLKIEEIIIPSIKMLPQNLEKNFNEKIPVIGFYDISSVICVYNEINEKYEFLCEWNGLFGKELFIDFTEEKPQYNTNNIEPLKTDLSSFVYDLIKIMSMPVDTIIIDEKWKFAITSNEDHPVLNEFDNFDRRKTAASPAFLMAMLLQEHRKIIKAKTGKKPKRIGFCLFDDFTPDESKRVKEQLQESCTLIKIQCCFI
uniref:Uncharacterized protein n=1 Tax=Panagrolaimus davidi TaxID=227884 RepID=A0A914QXQ1_9BILA